MSISNYGPCAATAALKGIIADPDLAASDRDASFVGMCGNVGLCQYPPLGLQQPAGLQCAQDQKYRCQLTPPESGRGLAP